MGGGMTISNLYILNKNMKECVGKHCYYTESLISLIFLVFIIYVIFDSIFNSDWFTSFKFQIKQFFKDKNK